MANVRTFGELLKSFDDFMNQVNWSKSPNSLYLPVDYILTIGGKRIRPLALLFVSELLEGNMEACLHAAYGLELFHNFSLIHDDIMDQSELRRSHQTVHKKFGTNAAILSGDVMMIDSMKFIRDAELLSAKNELQDFFIQTAREVCEGQALDMEFEKRSEIVYADYLEMIRLKTAVLLAFGFKSAAILSSRTDLADSFYEIGINIGIAFQLQDDYLDFYATETEFGKINGGDILQAKKSALILELMEQLNEKQKTDFVNWFQEEKNGEMRISNMTRFLEQYEIKEKLKLRINQYQLKTFECIDKLDLTLEQKKKVKEFVELIFLRKF